ncbi:DUF3135 domain-containing protein [Silvanigrella aquatica]|uniref:DUF3135 domain-containing protein n=1 Tax=Silvanigrella aquatica TaxID=1915309 RepID=A0A1L4D440_9BACT|nr:DUF3135 domain-containing protein [Silvanigrella aquatica]APJ04949.1 hypothetical protein AXG55_14010 [Silvanigrella aquatica]
MDKENRYVELHSPDLLKALQKRNDYFQTLPEEKREEAYMFQEYIDAELKKAGNQNNKLSILSNLMKEQMRELHKQSRSLSSTLTSFSKSLKEFAENKINNS